MKIRTTLALMLSIAGCASSSQHKPAVPTGFTGHWETPGPVDNGAPIGTARVRLDVDMSTDGTWGTWHYDFTRADGVRVGSGGGVWAPLDTSVALLRNGKGFGRECPIKLVDSRTLRMGDEKVRAIDLQRVQSPRT